MARARVLLRAVGVVSPGRRAREQLRGMSEEEKKGEGAGRSPVPETGASRTVPLLVAVPDPTNPRAPFKLVHARAGDGEEGKAFVVL